LSEKELMDEELRKERENRRLVEERWDGFDRSCSVEAWDTLSVLHSHSYFPLLIRLLLESSGRLQAESQLLSLREKLHHEAERLKQQNTSATVIQSRWRGIEHVESFSLWCHHEPWQGRFIETVLICDLSVDSLI
jgi:hypothetical protein